MSGAKEFYIGIDPGLKGGIGLVSASALLLLRVSPLPIRVPVLTGGPTRVDGVALKRIIDEMLAVAMVAGASAPPVCVLEEVHAAPKQGVVSMFNFGMSYGIVIGVLESAKIPIVTARPSVWKSAMGLSSIKSDSLALAAKLWPAHATTFSLKKNDGLAEAALLAEFGRRRLKID